MIGEAFSAVVAARGDAPAIVFGDLTVSYRRLGQQVAALRAGLLRLGAGAGGTVLIALPNCPEFVVTYYATAGLPVRVQAVDNRAKPHDLFAQVAALAPRVIVTDAAGAEVLAATDSEAVLVVVGRSGTPHVAFEDLLVDDDGAATTPVDAGEPWALSLSSGTTGEPKRVARSRRNQLAEAHHIIRTADITPDDVVLCVVPLFHALGQFCCMIVALTAGATLVLAEPEQDGLLDVDRIIDYVRRHRVTVFPSVPYILEALSDWPADRPADFSTVRLCLSGSNFLSAITADRFQARFATPIRQTYGSSEAGSVCWDCDTAAATPGSVGRPLDGVEVAILDDDGATVPRGTEGEIMVRSTAVAVDGADLDGGWCRTGDLGFLGADGHLRITGRKRVLVDTGGRKVNPVEVEEILSGHPRITAAGVVGVPLGDGGGDRLTAAVVVDGDVSLPQLRAYCLERLDPWKVPERFTILDDLPRTSVGKIRRATLQAWLAAAGDDERVTVGSQYAGWRSLPPAEHVGVVTDCLVTRTAAILDRPVNDIDVSSTPRAAGLDSLGALRLRMEIQEHLGQHVGLPDLLGTDDFRRLATRIADDRDGAVSPLVAGPATGRFPLSANQLAIWQADQVASEDAAYNVGFAASLDSHCDLVALQEAFQSLVDRHPILRTTYDDRGGEPVQHVAATAAADVRVIAVPADFPDRGEILSGQACEPFDLRRDLPLRVRLYVGAQEGPVLLVTLHHIATDFWSTVSMLRELGDCYADAVSGTGAYRPAPAHSYTDYVRWQAEEIAGPYGQRAAAHWDGVLSSAPAALELPTDRPRRVVQMRRGSTHFHHLRPETVDALRRFAGDRSLTAYVVALAAFHVLLHAYTAQRDISVAVITTSRQRHEFRDVLGYFVNPVVCRSELDPAAPFSAVVEVVQRALLASLEHQITPFASVVDQVGGRRDSNRLPLVEIAFGQNKAHDQEALAAGRFLSGDTDEPLRLGALALRPIALRQRGVVYDFSGALYEVADTMSIAWEYNTELFDSDSVKRLAAQYEQLLATLVGDPSAPVGGVPVVTGDQRDLLLRASHGAAAPPPESITHLIARRAADNEDRPALVEAAVTLTYGELARRSQSLATAIAATAGRRVLLWPATFTDAVVAALAGLRAGRTVEMADIGADAGVIRERLSANPLMPLVTSVSRRAELDLAGRVVICPEDLYPAVGVATDMRPVDVEPALVLRNDPDDVGPETRIGATAHAGWAGWLDRQYGAGRNELMCAAAATDRGTARAMAVLAGGGTVRSIAAADPAAMFTSVPDADLITMTASELAALLARLEPAGVRPRVAQLAVRGDVLTGDLVRRWRRLVGLVPVVHEYAPARTLLVVSAYPVPPDAAGDTLVPVGRPVHGVDRYVVDDGGRICPAGVVGELVVSPPGEVDVDDRPDDGGLRTGDLGYYRADGHVVVLGRAEQIVRVRGYRVELVAVEAALLGLSGVAAAMVSAERDAQGTRIVARVQAAEGAVLSTTGLRGLLRRRLPEYMVPAAVLLVDRVARRRDGTVVRSESAVVGEPESLLQPSREDDPASRKDGPATPIEVALCAICSKVLGVPQVGPEDNYFDLDGDSISALRIVAMADEAGMTITPRQLFTCATLRELAAVARISGAATLEPVPAGDLDVPLAPVQSWFFEQRLPSPGHWNQAVALTASGLDLSTVRTALTTVAHHHEAFRHRYEQDAGEWRQRVDRSAEAVRIVEHTSARGRDMAIAAAHRSLDLRSGPLLVAVLGPYDEGDTTSLVLVAHHVVVDYVSWRIIIEDLTRAYHQVRAGESAALPAYLPYASATRALAELASRTGVVAELDLWAPAAEPPAPVERLASAGVQRDRTVTQASLTRESTALLLAQAARSAGDRIQDLTLTAVAYAVARWAGADRLQIDVETHGRDGFDDQLNLTRTVGWLTSIHPVCFAVRPDVDPAGFQRDARRSLSRIPRGGIGYGLLRHLSPDPEVRRRMATVPSSPVNFNYLGRLGDLLGGSAAVAGELFTSVPLDDGEFRDPRGPRPYALEVSALIVDGRLTIRLDAATLVLPGEEAGRLARRICDAAAAIANALPTHDC